MKVTNCEGMPWKHSNSLWNLVFIMLIHRIVKGNRWTEIKRHLAVICVVLPDMRLYNQSEEVFKLVTFIT